MYLFLRFYKFYEVENIQITLENLPEGYNELRYELLFCFISRIFLNVSAPSSI